MCFHFALLFLRKLICYALCLTKHKIRDYFYPTVISMIIIFATYFFIIIQSNLSLRKQTQFLFLNNEKVKVSEYKINTGKYQHLSDLRDGYMGVTLLSYVRNISSLRIYYDSQEREQIYDF